MKQKSKSDNKGSSLPDTSSWVHQVDGEVANIIRNEIPFSDGVRSRTGELSVPELGPSMLVMNFKQSFGVNVLVDAYWAAEEAEEFAIVCPD